MNWKLILAAAGMVGMASGCATGGGSGAGSSTSAPAALTSTSATTPSTPCNSDPAEAAVGKKADPALVEQSRAQAGAKTARALRPNDVITTEYNPQRLNLRLDDSGVVTGVYCG